MNCPHCGTENVPESKFCVGCGAPTVTVDPATDTAVTPDRKADAKFDVNEIASQLVSTVKPVFKKVKPILSNKKVLMGIIGGAALLVVLAIVFAIFGGGNGYIQSKQTITYEAIGDDEYSIIVDKKVLSDTIESENGISSLSRSIDGKVAVILTEDGELYGVNGKKLKQLAEDVVSFELSVSGDYVVYASREDDDETTSLTLCKVSNGKTQEITDELGGNYAISPDGKSVAYFEQDDDVDNLMLYKGKKSTEITDDEGADLKGLSNSGKQIYVTIEDSDKDETFLYVYNAKGDREKLGTYSGDICFNDDHTQVMFLNGESKTYISTKGKEAKKASSDSLDLLIPSSSNSYFADGCTYPVSTLYNHVYVAGDEVWLIKKNSDKNVKLVSDAMMITLDDSAEYVYYIHDAEELCVAKISDGDKASERYKILVDEAVPYIVTSDRKYVYYADGDTLCSVNGKKGGKSKEITDDLESGVYLNDNDVAYYIVDGDLYACTNGKTGKKVLSDIDDITSYPNGLVLAENDDTIYATTGSKKPKKILDKD